MAGMPPIRGVTSWEDVPIFEGEEAEAAYWMENGVSLRLMEGSTVATAESTESVSITLRMDPRMLARIKRIARERYLNYQSMMKQWLSERMEHEVKGR
jgi:predicted DNA binding CopG/RHH family protein